MYLAIVVEWQGPKSVILSTVTGLSRPCGGGRRKFRRAGTTAGRI
jgi:hypothetical protein